MFRITPTKDNAVVATYQLLKSIEAKVTQNTVEEALKNHPDYPSLLATSDALNEWNIENISVKIELDHIYELPPPFLAHLSTPESDTFVLVKSIHNNIVEWVDTKEGLKQTNLSDFLHKWSGIALIAETNERSGEDNYIKKRKEELIQRLRHPFILTTSLFLIITILYNRLSFDWFYNTLVIVKIFGTIISTVLLSQNIDKNNVLVRKLCSAIGKKSDCNSILKSKASQITSWLSWSEVGFIYFAGGLISLLATPESKGLLLITPVFTVLYVFWSIYYQGVIARQWCALCLLVQGLLLAEFGISLSNSIAHDFTFIAILKTQFSEHSILHFLSIIGGFVGTILFWILLKPLLQKSQQIEPLKNNLRRFKNNPELFVSQLSKQQEMPFISSTMETVIIGNSLAQHTITIVSNPLCQPCSQMHRIIENMLNNNEKFNCQIIFSVPSDDKDKRNIIARSILSLPKNKQANAVHDWYNSENRNIKDWQKKFEVIEDEKAKKILKLHNDWCELAEVAGTPTLYLNGYKLPPAYRLEEMKMLLKYLPTADFAKS